MTIKTKQLAHQAREHELRRDEAIWALWWEMGLGKTKVVLDVAAHLFERGEIQCLLVMAPNAVYRNWITQEAPQHLGVPFASMSYPKTTSAEDTLRKRLFLDPDNWRDRLRLYCVSYDSLGKTFHGLEYSLQIAKMFRTMIVADESTAIAKHSSKQTKAAKELRRWCERAWIMSGTPVSESPYLAHSQVEFLDQDFWEAWGCKSYQSFRTMFGVYRWKSVGYKAEKSVPRRVGYRRLDHLNRILSTISSRLLKEDSGVELPPKTYTVRTFEPTARQWETYEQLRREYYAELDAEGGVVEARLALTRIMRLQQILCGYVARDRHVVTGHVAGMPIVETERDLVDLMSADENPRLQLCLALIAEASHKVIVWCAFTRDVELLCAALGDQVARYDGKTTEAQKILGMGRFRDPSDPTRVLVANVASISQGVTLTIAKTMIYYSNGDRIEHRLQSEDRNHRIGQDSPVQIIDLACEGRTVDSRKIECMRKKFDVAAQVTGDRYRDWIEPP